MKEFKKLTNAEIKSIEQVFIDMKNEAGSLGLALVEELKFSLQTIRKLKADIRKNGVIVEMQQGNYSIKRTNPALQTYNTLIKNYQSLVKQILEMFELASMTSSDNDDFENDNL